MNAKQFLKLVIALAVTFAWCFSVLVLSDGKFSQIFEETLSSFLGVATVFASLSFAMFSYIDNISKELTELRNEVAREKLNVVINFLSILKREVISNGAFIMTLLILEKIAKGMKVYFLATLDAELQPIAELVLLSLRLSFFLVSLLVVYIQIKGFNIALNYRDIISKSRK